MKRWRRRQLRRAEEAARHRQGEQRMEQLMLKMEADAIADLALVQYLYEMWYREPLFIDQETWLA